MRFSSCRGHQGTNGWNLVTAAKSLLRIRMMRGMFTYHALLVAIAVGGLIAGGLAAGLGSGVASDLWAAATFFVLIALLIEILRSLGRGDVGLDLIAALSMAAALLFGQALAGNVVALMYAGGQLLESYAEGRARREMTALLGRVAHKAMRYAGTELIEVPIEQLDRDDRVLIRRGEVVPVDGTLVSRYATLDQSALTGESAPVALEEGAAILSGVTNAGDTFDLIAASSAADSTYANVVRLVTQAQKSKAPSVRIADRYAIWFLLFTLAVSGVAWWASGDRIRALAVLVTATPCPLILALPVAIIAGISRSAKHGALVKSGGAIEALAKVRTAILDKTGTLTFGQVGVSGIWTVGGWSAEEVLRLAASLDQASNHVVAEALIKEAGRQGLILTSPKAVREMGGSGIAGRVGERSVAVGGGQYIMRLGTAGDLAALRRNLPKGTANVTVAIDGQLAGLILLEDRVRPDAESLLDSLRSAGINRIVLASGDRKEVVESVASSLAIDEALSELTPQDKLEVVRRESASSPTMMVGDGINDAPALASATVGVAMGARGAAASSESADIVLLVDRLDSLASALRIAHRTRRIALQSIGVGLGLSVIAMLVAAWGYLPPVAGALVQEAIDVAVILNALRVLKDPVESPRAAFGTGNTGGDKPPLREASQSAPGPW